MDDEQERDSFSGEENRDLLVKDELPAVENLTSISEITESGQGLIDSPPIKISFFSEDTRTCEFVEPSQVAEISVGISSQSTGKEVSAGSDKVPDLSLEGQSLAEMRSGEQQGAIPKTRKTTTVEESECPIASVPSSENIESDKGSSDAQQPEITLSSEVIKPSHLAGISFYPGSLLREEGASQRKEVLDFGAPSSSAISTKSAKQLDAISKTRKVNIDGEKIIITPQKLKSIYRGMGKLKIEGPTGSELPGACSHSNKFSTISCNEENKNATQADVVAGLEFFDFLVKFCAANEKTTQDICTLCAIEVIKRYSKRLEEATKLDMNVKILILKTILNNTIVWYKEKMDNILKNTSAINRLAELIPFPNKHAASMKECGTRLTSFHKQISLKLGKFCDCCISDKVEVFRKFMVTTDKLIKDEQVTIEMLDDYKTWYRISLVKKVQEREAMATFASHQQQPNSPLRLDPPSCSGDVPRVPVVESFSQDDVSTEVSPGKDDKRSGRSRVQEGADRDQKRNRKDWRNRF